MRRARPTLTVVGLACVLLLHSGVASAEWFDDYERGVQALAQGKPERAVRYLAKAIRRRPNPGTNVITYGTNRLKEYYPYLKLAEAHLELGDLEAAEDALSRSEETDSEPADARARLEARWREAAAAAAARAEPSAPSPPPVTTAPTTTTSPPVPPVAAAPKTGTLVVRTQPESGASVLANGRFLGATPLTVELDGGDYELTVRLEGVAPERVSVHVEPGETTVLNQPLNPLRSPPSPPKPAPRPPPPSPKPRVEPPSLLVVTEPPGTTVYLDDELIGSTDPQTGRLRQSDVAPGPHRIRLSHADYREIVDDIAVESAGETMYQSSLAKPLNDAPTAVSVDAAPPVTEQPNDSLGRGWLLLSTAVGLGLASLVLAARRWRQARSAPAATLTAGALEEISSASFRPRTPSGGRDDGWRRGAETRTRVAADTTEGSRFGEFRLVKRLGRGGMASVYLAERNGEQFALKKPHGPLLEDVEFRERFLREADIGRTLHHPNIIRIFEKGEANGVPFFTMELVEGGTLREKIVNRDFTDPRDSAAVILQIAEALDYAHLKGVVHRDLKPSNIMILENGTVKVMDYGIARAQRFQGLTATGAFLGTPNYIAPETAEGKSTDARADLYSLGIIFYEMLTGQRPFEADNPLVTLKKHCSEPPTPPSSIAPKVPRRLEAIILKLLAKSPDERYPDAEHLLVELRDYLNAGS